MKQYTFNLTLLNLIYRLRKFKDIIYDELEKAMLDNSDVVVGMIKKQLYNQGINGNNEEIMGYAPYKPRTIKKKRRKGQPTDRVTLRDTGAFYNSMQLKRVGGGFAIVASDYKTSRLQKKYKPTILRLTNENLNILLKSKVRPYLVRRLKVRLHED